MATGESTVTPTDAQMLDNALAAGRERHAQYPNAGELNILHEAYVRANHAVSAMQGIEVLQQRHTAIQKATDAWNAYMTAKYGRPDPFGLRD